MSKATALDNINLRPCNRWGHTEYSLEYHQEFLAATVPLPRQDPAWARALYDRFAFDFLWTTDDGPVNWAQTGRVTNMGHADYAANGSDHRASSPSPFRNDDEVWAFDAVAEYGLPEFESLVAFYEEKVRQGRERTPDQLVTGGYYKTIVSGAIESFGWDMLLAAAADGERMERVFDSFFRRTLFHMRAWASTSVEVLIQHDDFVWSAGPFMSPDYYRNVIIPRYAALWEPLHAAGKKVLFCSDGDFSMFAADIVAAGADGLIFEPCNDFDFMTERFGDAVCLVGSAVDCRDLTLGHWDRAARDIERTFAALRRCRGAILAVGNHVPANIPAAMMERYFETLLPQLARRD
jgi:hypothetical protein